MGLFKRGLIKAGMIVGSIFAAGAAVGAAAKSAYKKKRNSYENKYEAKDATYTYAKPSDGKYTHMNNKGKNFKTNQNTAASTTTTTSSTVDLMNKEHAVFKSSSNKPAEPKETASYGSATPLPNNAKAVYVWDKPRPESEFHKTSSNTTTPNNSGRNFKIKEEDKAKKKEVEKRIKELSEAPISANGLGAVLLSYLIPFMFIFVGLLAGYIIDMLELGQFISLSIFSFAFLMYLSLLAGGFKYKKNTKKTREAMESLRYSLNYYKKLRDKSIDPVNNEYTTEVIVYQTALRNMANTYNNYISQVSNLLYTKIFSITQFDCEENVQQENIILTRTK